MKKQETTLKLRKGLSVNHNETALKVCKGVRQNHNQSELKVYRVIAPNHNETALKIRKLLQGKHNESMLKVRKIISPNHNETMLKVRKGLTVNHNKSILKERKGIQQNHNQSALKVCKAGTLNHNETALKVQKKVSVPQRIFAVVILLTLMFTQWGGTIGTAKAAQCTAQQGQSFIDAGQYQQAIQEFTCVINAQPNEAEGYRGRIEARLLLGQYSEALHDFTLITVHVLPEQPDVQSIILTGYSARLTVNPNNIPALTGKGFMEWAYFSYPAAIHTLDQLLQVQPNSIYGNLFLGSSRLLKGVAKTKGIANIERAIDLAPNSPDVHFIVADAYTYGLPDPQRAFAEATLALNGGLSTPRVHAILASSYLAFGDMSSAAEHIKIHFDMVTTEFVTTNPMDPNTTDTFELVPGRTYSIPVPATAGETISITTSSSDYWDTILVLLGPDGSPVAGADDDRFYFAELDWVAGQTGTYLLQVTFFESVNSGEVVVTRN